jgi:hypothetical protein
MLKRGSFSIVLIVFIKLLIDVIFSEYILNRYAYYGYIVEHGIEKTCLMWFELFLFIPFYLVFVNGKTLKPKIMLFMSLIYFLPGLSIYQYIKVDAKMFFAWNVFWWILIVLGAIPPLRIKTNAQIAKSKMLVLAIIICIALLVIFISWKYTGFRFTITFTDEYSLRAEERKIVLARFIAYLYASAPIILSLGLAISVKRRKYGISALFVLLQILNFSIGGHKTILLMSIISIGIILLGESVDEKKRGCFIVLAMLVELALEIILALFGKSLALIENISRRVYFLPQILNVHYYAYSSQYGYDFYARGPARIFGIKSKYGAPLPQIISQVYFGTDGNANNGLFSEAFSNLGLCGCFVLPLFIVLTIGVLNIFIKQMDYTFVTLYAFFCAFIWGSGNVTTGLMTNGLLLSAIIMYLIPKEYINSDSIGNRRKNKSYLYKY